MQDVGAAGVAEEERCAWVFGVLRCFIVEVAFCARVFGLDVADWQHLCGLKREVAMQDWHEVD